MLCVHSFEINCSVHSYWKRVKEENFDGTAEILTISGRISVMKIHRETEFAVGEVQTEMLNLWYGNLEIIK